MKLTSEIQNEIQKLRHQIKMSKSSKDKKVLQDRIAKLLKS